MECQLCNLSDQATLFWVSLGPSLTLIGSILLLRAAYGVLKARGIGWQEIRAILARQFGRSQKVEVGTVVELEGAPGVGIAIGGRGNLYVTPEDIQAARESAKRLKEIGTSEFELAVIEAVEELLAVTTDRDQRLELHEAALAASKNQAKTNAEREKEIQRRIGEERDASLQRHAQIDQRISDLQVQGMWPTFLGAVLIPLGIVVGLLVDGCIVYC